MMHTSNPKCILILSTKSSGSSALQNFLASQIHVNHITKTRHGENETLYWVKAASVLGLPQVDMYDSEVPIPKQKARTDLIQLLADNLGDSYAPPDTDEELVFNGWRLLCYRFSPVFIEKSPHHLHQYASLELISRFIQENPDIEFFVIGLIRNPMDTVYSMWKRWRGLPEKNQFEWYTAYSNLLKFRDDYSGQMKMVRYEDMVQNKIDFTDIFNFAGIQSYQENFFHERSLNKWRKDRNYGFELDLKVADLSEKFKYSREEMKNTGSFFWPVSKNIAYYQYRSVFTTLKLLRKIKNMALNQMKV